MPSSAPAPEHAELLRGLAQSPKRIPVSYLYDARGSALYGQITELEEYYPYAEERKLLAQSAARMAQYVPRDGVVVELGCGDASKTCLLLRAVAARHHGVEFVGIDVSQAFLDQASANIHSALAPLITPAHKDPATAPGAGGVHAGDVRVHMVRAEYLSGLAQARRLFPSRPLVVLWLGSSVGNLEDAEARAFFRRLLRVAGPRTRVLLATDLWKSPAVLARAYDDPHGVSGAFIKNGLRHALRSLGVRVAEEDGAVPWEYEAHVDAEQRRVEMWVRCLEHVDIPKASTAISAGERVFLEISRKFTREDVAALAQASGWVPLGTWSTGRYAVQLLASAEESLRLCWAGSDAFFAGIPDWASTPIEFRRPFSFYYGHLAAFAALKMLPARQGGGASPLDVMFSRGIDPLLLDPSHCHKHPAPPKHWPDQAELCAYVGAAREDILAHLADCPSLAGGEDGTQAWGGLDPASPMRGVMLALEHEWMHLETLAYMQAQEQVQAFCRGHHSAGAHQGLDKGGPEGASKALQGSPWHGASPPLSLGLLGHSTGPVVLPDPSACASPGLLKGGEASALAPALDVLVPPGPVSLGVDLSPGALAFAWDNEGPAQAPAALTHALAVSSRPVSVGEFHAFVTRARGYSRPELWLADDWLFLQKRGQSSPATWALGPSGSEDDYWVLDVGDPVEAAQALASVDGLPPATGQNGAEAEACAPGAPGQAWRMRPWRAVQEQPVLVSLAEAQAFCRAVGGGVRVMTELEWNRIAQCSLEGEDKQEHGPHGSSAAGPGAEARKAKGVLPLEQLQRSVRCGGWEWTSTPFEPLPGFQAMEDYPEYSTDFFDGAHFVLKGASPATHTAMRRDSFRNFYQRQYPYVFAKFRCCREAQPEA